MQRFSFCAARWIVSVLCAFSFAALAAEPTGLPSVVVLRITGVTPTSVTLNADVQLHGLPANGGFEYGPDTQYGSAIGFVGSPAVTEGTTEMSFPIGGLTTGKVYHYRASASSSAGTVVSEDHTLIAGHTPPLAGSNEYTQRDGPGPFELDVIVDDHGFDNTTLHIASVTQPAHGHVEILPGGITVSYLVTEAGYAGDDTFTYTVEDSMGDQDTGRVVMHVGRVPVVSTVLFVTGDGVPIPATAGALPRNRPRFAAFGIPSLNNAGQVAFTASTSSRSERGSVIIGPDPLGQPKVVVSSGDRAPGRTGALLTASFASFGEALLNDSGDVAFIGRLKGPGVNSRNDRGIWIHEKGVLHMVARAGDPAPGTTGIFKSFRSVALSDRLYSPESVPGGGAGVAFLAQLVLGPGEVSPASDMGLWRYLAADAPAPALQLLVQEGGAIRLDAADDSPEEIVRSFSALEPQKGAAGHGFGLVVDVHNDHSLNVLARVNLGEDHEAIVEFRSDAENPIRLVASSQSSVNGSSLLDRFGPPTQSWDGQNAFVARVKEENFPTPEPTHPAVVYFANDVDTLTVFRVLEQGAEVPEVPGAAFSSFGNVVTNGVGIFAVTATIAGADMASSNDTGIWLDRYAGPQMLAREGAEAPGTGGAKFFSFLSLAMPGNGRPLFKAVTGSGRAGRRSAGVWFTDDDLVLRLAIREGDTVPGPKGGRIRLISVLERVADSATQTRSFDVNGDFVFRANFDSGRQAIVKADIP